MADLLLDSATLAGGAVAFPDQPFALALELAVDAVAVFDVDVSLDIHRRADGVQVFHRQLSQDGWDVAWLPRGRYRVHALASRVALPPGEYEIHLALWHKRAGELVKAGATLERLAVTAGDGGGPR